MKTGLAPSELASELKRQMATKIDYRAHTSQLALKPDINGEIRLHGLADGKEAVEPMLLKESAHRQFAQRLGVPKPYYNKMREKAPELLASNCNHWLVNEPAEQFVRTLDSKVRAVLSSRYLPLDNLDFAKTVLPVIGKLGATIASCQITDSKFYLKIIMPGLEHTIVPGGGEMGQGHDTFHQVKAAFICGNSEIGEGALFADSGMYSTGCTNLLIRRSSSMRKAHLGATLGRGDDGVTRYLSDETRKKSDAALFDTVGDIAEASLDGRIFAEQVAELEETRGNAMDSPTKAVERVSKKFQLSDDEHDSVLDHLIRGGDISQYGLVNAVTRASQDVECYDRATQLEYVGGDILSLSGSQWKDVSGESK
jgi:hypothetical protein